MPARRCAAVNPWRTWLLLAVACWSCVVPGFALCGPENRVSDFFAHDGETRRAESLQVADSHQGKVGCGYETASGVHDYLYANADRLFFSRLK